MNSLRLPLNAQFRLAAQTTLNGTFQHTLSSPNGAQLTARVGIEQCTAGIVITIETAGIRDSHSVALDKYRADTAQRVARLIEATANGYSLEDVPDVDDYQVVSDIEQQLRRAIRMGRGVHQLSADELEPELLIERRLRGGFAAQLRLNDAVCMLTLPADPRRAYTMLAENIRRFLQGYRCSLAAVA